MGRESSSEHREPALIWRAIPSCPGYEASDTGQVRRLPRVGGAGRRFGARVLSQKTATGKYAMIGITGGERNYRTEYVHRLVCEAFHGPAPADKPNALHDDGDVSNNRSANLYWGSSQTKADETLRRGHRPLGEAVAGAILTENAVRSIRGAHEGQSDLAARFGVGQSCISRVINRDTWKHLED